MIVLSNLDEMIPVKCNTEDQAVFSNMDAATKLDLPWLCVSEPHEGVAVVIGGGPSMRSLLPLVAAQKAAGHKLFAVNGTVPTLNAAGIEPDYFVMLDAREENAKFIQADCQAHNLIASQCHPVVFAALEGKEITLWHPNYQGVERYVKDRECALIGGGTTVGLQTVSIAYAMGFREIHLYGFDSSFSETGLGHAYPQPQNEGDERHPFVVNFKVFHAAPWMARQAMEFQTCAKQLSEGGANIYVHGDGLLPEIAKEMATTTLTAVYDLSVSPPTYEFLSFLHEAERARVDGGYDRLNIVFQPGPDGGFRADHLPPSKSVREMMLWKICVPAARMLPSACDVSVLKRRAPVAGEVFPPEWAVGNPVAHYGPSYCKGLKPILAASDAAMAYVERKYPGRFVAITLRNAKHWPSRNSNMDAWLRVSRYLERHGLTAVFIPDEDGAAPDGAYHVCPEAFFDLDVRAALYEQAELCLGVSNGPTVLMAVLNSRFLIFDKPDPSFPCAKQWLMDTHGFDESPQYSAQGRIVWGSGDSFEEMIPEIEAALFPERLQKTA